MPGLKASPIAAAAFGLLAAGGMAAAEPGHRVAIGAFEIDRTEVTIGQFRAYKIAASIVTAAEREGGGFEYTGGWTRRPGWTWEKPYGEAATDNEPVVHVSWDEALGYCRSKGGRLPSMAEWSRAAYTETRDTPPDGYVAGRTYPYPVGNYPDGMNNNRRRHAEVATTRRGVNGLYDMGANVWEWIADRRGEAALTAGGSWWYGPEATRIDGTQWKQANFYAVYIGFRCAYDLKR